MSALDERRPFELLHQAAEYLGATVCLMTTADVRDAATGRMVDAQIDGAQPTRITAVVPQPRRAGVPRWLRLARGQLLGSVDLTRDASLDAAATLLARQLGMRIREHMHERRAA